MERGGGQPGEERRGSKVRLLRERVDWAKQASCRRLR